MPWQKKEKTKGMMGANTEHLKIQWGAQMIIQKSNWITALEEIEGSKRGEAITSRGGKGALCKRRWLEVSAFSYEEEKYIVKKVPAMIKEIGQHRGEQKNGRAVLSEEDMGGQL